MKSSPTSSHLSRFAWGLAAGLLAATVMLLAMTLLRVFLHLPTPTELIFDRAFPLITVQFFIDSLVRAGGYTPLKLQGVFGALAGQFAVAGAGGALYAWHTGRGGRGWKLVVPGVLAVWLLAVGLLWPQLLTNYRGHPPASAVVYTCLGMLISFASCGAALMFFHRLLVGGNPAPGEAQAGALSRRRFVAAGLGAAGAVALGGMLRRLFGIGSFAYDGTEYLGPGVVKITPTDQFYQVTKNLVDPDVARDIWRLEITGHVETPRVYTFAELTAFPAVEQEITLQCISYRVGGGLISNALWKGVPLPALLAAARPRGGAAAVMFHAADGYFETFPFANAAATLVAWEMNGAPLPARHGFPVRLVVPGIYGERSPKWVTRLELLAADDPRLKINRHGVEGVGFYTEQGWGPNIIIPTTSRFDAPRVRGDRFEENFAVGEATELRGMAFGGDRGVSRVEVSFDGGDSWSEAQISQPGTRVSWSLWTCRWTPEAVGEAKLVVRAVNGDGAAQIETDRNTVPQGATGLHRVKAIVEGSRSKIQGSKKVQGSKVQV